MNYLTHEDGAPVDEIRPLPVDDVTQGSDRVAAPVETVTFNSAAAAGSTGRNALDKKPILNLVGNKVGSFWGSKKNKMMEFSNSNDFGTLTETASSASVVIRDAVNVLDKLFETASGSRRYILRATDNTGAVLYGWIGDITVSGISYTVPVHNAVTSGAQSWVGTLADFDSTNVQIIEIFAYESSFVWVTGTVLTREVALPKLKTQGQLKEFFDSLSNGDYAIDYEDAAIYFKKTTTGTTDTCNYDSLAAATVSSSSGAGAAQPTVDSYTVTSINLAAGADQVLVAAPGTSKQLWVMNVAITTNAQGTVSFQDEDNTAISGIMQLAQYGGFVAKSDNFAIPVWKVATNKALEVDIVTSEVDGWLGYAIVSV